MSSNVLGRLLASGEVSLYVPSTLDVDKHMTPEQHTLYVKRVEEEFSHLFGGATSTAAVGSWLSSTGTLVREAVTIVSSSADLNPSQVEAVRAIARTLARELGQEAVLVKWNGETYTVAPF